MEKKKAIFKFNGGKGALLCSKCSKIIKTGSTMTEEEILAMKGKASLEAQYCEDCGGVKPDVKIFYLTRAEDNKVIAGLSYKFVEWNENGTGKDLHAEPQVGFSFIMDPNPIDFTWLTTKITEIVEDNEKVLKFKTQNSTYTLEK
jgi:hypothetical protein